MRNEFEKLDEIANIFKIGNFQFNEDEGNYTGTKGTALSYLRGAWIIYQHRQTEVDDLQKQVDAANRKLNEIASIAKRARHGDYYTDSGRNAGLNIASELEQALKGDKNES